MKEKRILIGALALLVFTVSVVSAAGSTVYLVPTNSNVSEGYCNTSTVELRLNTTEQVAGWNVTIAFDPSCVNITDVDFTGSNFIVSDWGNWGDHILAGGSVIGAKYTGDLFLANLTIHCECIDCAYCESPLVFTGTGLYDDYGGMLPSPDTIDGTFTCGTPCLGDCYNATTYELIEYDVPCYECLEELDRLWENHPCPVGDCGCTCPPLFHDLCPECCDGIDNDDPKDGIADWPNDPKCACCIDQTETVDDGCSTPCVPELPTLALAGIGILGIALLARKRD
jgi:hypothetical protein